MQKRFYRSWISFLGTECPILWNLANRLAVYKALDPLVLKTTPKPRFNVSNVQDGKILQPNGLLWNEKNMAKWTHDSPNNSGLSEQWKFSCLSLQCPDAKTARKIGSRPELLLEFWKWDKKTELDLAFDKLLSISVREDIASSDIATYRHCIENLFEFVRPIFIVQMRSRWIYRKTQFGKYTLDGDFPFGAMISTWRDVKEPSKDIFRPDNGPPI